MSDDKHCDKKTFFLVYFLWIYVKLVLTANFRSLVGNAGNATQNGLKSIPPACFISDNHDWNQGRGKKEREKKERKNPSEEAERAEEF